MKEINREKVEGALKQGLRALFFLAARTRT